MKNIPLFLLTKFIGLYINVLSFVLPRKAAQIAYAFFSEPREGKLILNKLPQILKKAKLETFRYKGQHFQTYIWTGNENKILLVHGWESNASRWQNLLPYLKETGSTIIAIDGPAHGLSSGKEFTIPDYAEYINIVVTKYQPQYLIGHSIGGKTCLYYQSLYQNPRIKKMVILGSPSDFKIILQNYINLLSLNAKISQELENHYLHHFKLKIEEFSGHLFASKLKTRGLIAHDSDDTVVSFEEAKKIASSWKNADFMETNGLGHSMHDDAFYQKVTRFLFDTK